MQDRYYGSLSEKGLHIDATATQLHISFHYPRRLNLSNIKRIHQISDQIADSVSDSESNYDPENRQIMDKLTAENYHTWA